MKEQRTAFGGVGGKLVFALTMALVCGCSEKETPIDTSNATVNMAGIATAVRETLVLMKAYPDEAEQHVDTVIDVLDSAKEYPLGEHQATFDQLVAGCTALKEMGGQSADAGKITTKVDELLRLVSQLPQLTPDLMQKK